MHDTDEYENVYGQPVLDSYHGGPYQGHPLPQQQQQHVSSEHIRLAEMAINLYHSTIRILHSTVPLLLPQTPIKTHHQGEGQGKVV